MTLIPAKMTVMRNGGCEKHENDLILYWLTVMRGTTVLFLKYKTMLQVSTCHHHITNLSLFPSISRSLAQFHQLGARRQLQKARPF